MNESATPDQAHEAAPTARRLETRARLIDAAAEVFVEEGLQGASVESICSRAGFTRGAFYSNFSSKEELFLAALTHEYELRIESLRAQASELGPHLQTLCAPLDRQSLAAYVTDFLAPTAPTIDWFLLETEFVLLATRDADLAPGFTAFLGRFEASVVTVVEGLVAAAGRRFRIPVDHAVAAFSSLYERSHRLRALNPGTSEYTDELGERIAELLFAITEPLGSAPPGADDGASPPQRTMNPADTQ
ncbi:hypothetical protein K8P10_002738 [Leucobacter sp. Psy1]|uniref:TetR/AcrR family transcriptional regulator n=1 Tax=Leucobacter sp. Psy1 TaxID=2875729 RepID=UPI001CD58B68|nr:TetR/AcrR family transcriptional regulator [Leucobacter sp. Psy1]UBH07227.1 hypothetical protein K8P10_002738 [Leucobacter sp. Psy1]